MTTKTDPTNEQVALALGWIYGPIEPDTKPDLWHIPGTALKVFGPAYHVPHPLVELPNFTHDNNASWKYVWPVLMKYYQNIEQLPIDDFTGQQVLEQILWNAFVSPNPAMYFATKLMELKNK